MASDPFLLYASGGLFAGLIFFAVGFALSRYTAVKIAALSIAVTNILAALFESTMHYQYMSFEGYVTMQALSVAIFAGFLYLNMPERIASRQVKSPIH